MIKIEDFNYDQLIGFYTSNFKKEFGENKLFDIHKKVMTSNGISGLISQAKYKRVAPGSEDILACLNEIFYFMFAKNRVQTMAGLITLERWNQEVNSNQFLLDEAGLKLRALNLIKFSTN